MTQISPTGGVRILGTGMPGLYWGRFWWKQAGPGLRLYVTRYKPLVLISAGGLTYGVTPREEGRFVEELRRRLESGDLGSER